MIVSTIQPIRKQVTVGASQAKAFEVFTAGIGRWWNPEFKIGAEPYATAVIEPNEGGRWYERGEGGAECDWGRVLVWDPPQRVVLDWQIDASWQYDANLHTELEVRFVADGPSATRVELEHRGLEAMGDKAEEIRGIFDSPGGWAGLLERFGGAAMD
ncbi:MAG: SRPBCC family protein [Acidimicrobiales bacterium]